MHPDLLKTLGDVATLALRHSAEAFAEAVGAWALVGQPERDTSGWFFRTGSIDQLIDHDEGMVRMVSAESSVHLLKKRDSEHFADTILIGRSDSNDVVVRDKSVSKLHARARQDPDGDWRLMDAGSSNGTMVNEAPVDEVGQVLTSGDILCFGERFFYVFDPPKLYDIALRMRR